MGRYEQLQRDKLIHVITFGKNVSSKIHGNLQNINSYSIWQYSITWRLFDCRFVCEQNLWSQKPPTSTIWFTVERNICSRQSEAWLMARMDARRWWNDSKVWLLFWKSVAHDFIGKLQGATRNKRSMGLDVLLDNTDRRSRHIVMYDKQIYQTTLQITLNATRSHTCHDQVTISAITMLYMNWHIMSH